MSCFDPDYEAVVTPDRDLFALLTAPPPAAPTLFAAPPVGSRPGPITDAGEKIGAARKDLTGRVTLASLSTLTPAERRELVTKDNVWPRLDYRALAEEGTDRFRLAVVKRLRDALPSAPEHKGHSAADRETDFVTAIATARQIADRFLAGSTGELPRLADLLADTSISSTMSPAVVAILDRPLARTRRYLVGSHRTALEAEIEQTGWPQVRTRAGNGQASDKPRIHERPPTDRLERVGPPIPRPAILDANALLSAFSFRGVEFGNWESQEDRERNVQLTWDALHDLAEMLHIPPAAIGLDKRLALAFGARGRGHAAAHYERVRTVTNISKIRGAGSLGHEQFHALDHWISGLIGQDPLALATEASATTTASATQFHGIKYVSSKEPYKTQRDLHNLADALESLMKTIHFVHEDRDQALARARQNLATAESRADNHRPTVKRYIEKLRSILQHLEDGGATRRLRSEYLKTAITLGSYWYRPQELAARAFEAWLEDKLAAQSRQSPYLVRATTPDAWTAFRCCPYPQGSERIAINRQFDRLIDALQPFFGRLSPLLSAA